MFSGTAPSRISCQMDPMKIPYLQSMASRNEPERTRVALQRSQKIFYIDDDRYRICSQKVCFPIIR